MTYLMRLIMDLIEIESDDVAKFRTTELLEIHLNFTKFSFRYVDQNTKLKRASEFSYFRWILGINNSINYFLAVNFAARNLYSTSPG